LPHPAVALLTTAARVSLLHEGEPQSWVNQLSTGGTIELLADWVARERREEGFRQLFTSGLDPMVVNALVHSGESLCEGMNKHTGITIVK
jgi:hypothetical protein